MQNVERKRRSNMIDLEAEEGAIPTGNQPGPSSRGLSGHEQPIAIPQTPSEARQAVSIEDLIRQTMQENRESREENKAAFRDLRRDTAQLKHEAKEARRIADKALVNSEETKQHFTSLEQRVAKLERSGVATSAGPNRSSGPSSQATRDWDLLGGERGDLIVLSGFRQWASQEERLAEMKPSKSRYLSISDPSSSKLSPPDPPGDWSWSASLQKPPSLRLELPCSRGARPSRNARSNCRSPMKLVLAKLPRHPVNPLNSENGMRWCYP